MPAHTPVDIAYFSDVLCVWAYVAQIRVDELKRHYNSNISLHYHFTPIFGCTEKRISNAWCDKGGYQGYSQHVREVCSRFPHVTVHERIWQDNIPASSVGCHHFIKAVQLLEDQGQIPAQPMAEYHGNTLFEETVWRLRQAFFRDMLNIAELGCHLTIAGQLGLPVARITELLNNGSAMAAMCCDEQLGDGYKVEGSPTYVLNEGRQKLYGNVGYRIIEANVHEILERPENQATWC
ncbi:MAG: hypothetical protein A2V90_02980 [Gammaproteobacteria bacterium RBG_16_57_12]|nr:MAG: hypothetical protein A2V90_02980 [Gammaproteobacteria bacterium RBG_16_57_12]